MSEKDGASRPRFEAVDEYGALRDELSASKKYVFERPLLIITVTVAAANVALGPLRGALPIGLAAVTLFNFWFTTNRLRSMARIIGYIQLILEERYGKPWSGWETSLSG